MTKPPAMPELPEKLIFSKRLAISEAAQVPMDAECCRVIQATLDYIRSNYALAALQSAQPAEVSDEEIDRIWSWSATAEAERTATTQQHAFAYALLALRPQAVPMMDEQLCEALGIDGADDWTYEVRDKVQVHFGVGIGITAQAKGGE